MHRPVIFLGPSLPLAEAQRELPGGIFLPPVKRGSLLPFLDDPPSSIGIVDGEFFQSFAVSTQEILLYLERGVPVFGSSSIGALRAVELEPYGMIGVGRVFEMFRDGQLDADDEVAMTFCPVTLRPLSEPMINFRVALGESCRQGVLSRAECRLITRTLKAAYFPERTLPRLFQELQRILPPERAIEAREWWRRSAPDVKAADARLLLTRMRAACEPLVQGSALVYLEMAPADPAQRGRVDQPATASRTSGNIRRIPVLNGSGSSSSVRK